MAIHLKDTGEPQTYRWVSYNTDDAFIALDLNNNGEIDSGAEIFGEGTTLIETGLKAKNGFEALEQYDRPINGGNGDGVISPQDRIWAKLLVWFDKDINGISSSSEVHSISEYNLLEIKLSYITNSVIDSAGNDLRYWSSATDSSNLQYDVVDVFFKKI